MNPTNVSETLDAADRVIRAARAEVTRGCRANAVLFLRAAIGNLNQVAATLEGSADVVPMPRKETIHAR
jgi:hypothetical protein